MSKKSEIEYFCLAVCRNYENVWRFIGKFETLDQAQQALEERRAYTGTFNYDNAELRVISRSQAKKEFGAQWEYHPIGEVRPQKTTKSKQTHSE